MISKIISGGQTGADQAGLFAARLLGIETGGFVPLGYMTEAGPAPWLKEYGLVETPHREYQYRTVLNVQHSDATVVFGRRSPGSNFTEEVCRQSKKVCLWIWLTDDVWDPVFFKDMLHQIQPKVLNVAGNRESRWPGIESKVVEFLLENLPC